MTLDLVTAFQEMKRIHGFCPCCGEPFRLSEAMLFTTGPPPRTPFDALDAENEKLMRAMERFDQREESIREKARELGKAIARRRLRRIAAPFTARRIDTQDVKVVFDPVDYVAFRGLSAHAITGIELIDGPPKSTRREKAHDSIQRAIRKGNIEWQTWRIDAGGMVCTET